MKLKVDKENDAIYFRLDDSKIIESEEVEKDLILDFNESGNIVGIEILNISQRTNKINFKSLQFETVLFFS
jgi:uncharacterized protein YuzE